MKHTDLPWCIEKYRNDNDYRAIVGLHGEEVATEIRTHDTELIVKAVNNHERLLEALEEMLEAHEENEWSVSIAGTKRCHDSWDKARAAIKEAQGEL